MGLESSALRRYAYLRERIVEVLPPPARIVELGAAPGDQCVALAQQGYAVTAVDIGIGSDAWADAAEGRMAALFDEHGVQLVEWDLEQVPYPLPDGAYDGVVLTEVFEHLRDYPIRSLTESARVLRPGGYLFFTTPNAGYLLNRLRLLMGRSVYTPLPDWIAGLPHARHAREYLFGEIQQLIALVGFEPVLVTGRHFHLDGGSAPKRWVKRGIDTLARARPTLGPMIVVVARRPEVAP